MNDILRILLGEARPRQAADESLFLSGRNYLGVRPPMPNIPPVAGLPPVPPQVGPVAGLVTINDNGQIIKLAPGEVYEGGIRIIPGPAPTFTGLLDDYPGAAAAYSLRRLSVNYTGPLVQVRRASDNDETTIPYKDDGTLDVGVLNAFAAGTDAFVSEWPDQSGNANDATQTTAANQPKIYDSSTGVVTKNGKPGIVGVSISSQLSLSSSIGFSDFCLIHVYEENTANLMTWSGNDLQEYYYHTGAFHRINGMVNFAHGLSANAQVLDFANRSSGSVEVHLNGASVGTATYATAYSFQHLFNRSSGGFGYTAPIQEFILWQSDQSANRAGIETNINDHYTIY